MTTIAWRTMLGATLWAVVVSSADAQRVSVREWVGVDLAGNTLATLASRDDPRQETAVLLDASGRLLHCRVGSSVLAVRPRKDAPGFLVQWSGPGADGLLERWDGHGSVEWAYVRRPGRSSVARPGVESAPDGGAVLVEEFNVPAGGFDAQLVRLGANGTERWRTSMFIDPNGLADYGLSIDRYERVYFTASPHRNPLALPHGTARLGMVNADGRPGWLHAEARSALAETRLLDNGSGDVWWFLGSNYFGPAQLPYLPSKLMRWTAWGMPLYSLEGPALVAGTEMYQPAVDDGESVWYLALGESRDPELVRVDTHGRNARRAIDVRSGYRTSRNGGRYFAALQLSVAAGSAWIAGTRPGASGELTIERHAAQGRAWSIRLDGQEILHRLLAAATGDARLVALDVAREASLSSYSARGELLWRTSLSEVHDACDAR